MGNWRHTKIRVRKQQKNTIWPYTPVCTAEFLHISFKAKLRLEPETLKKHGHQAANVKVTSFRFNKYLSITTDNMHMKFETDIPK